MTKTASFPRRNLLNEISNLLNTRHWTDYNLTAGSSFQTRAGAELTGRECCFSCVRARHQIRFNVIRASLAGLSIPSTPINISKIWGSGRTNKATELHQTLFFPARI